MRKIGLLGGTFDPIHNGHLNLAIEMLEKEHLDEVWFIPAAKNPLKQDEAISPAHRFQMLQLAIADIPFFKAFDLEINKRVPSFTIDTLKELKGMYRDEIFYLILGQDAFSNFYQWKDPKGILATVSLLIGCRNEECLQPWGDEEIKQALTASLRQIKLMDISATAVRERLKKDLYIGHLVPGKVVDYIYENSLYSFSS